MKLEGITALITGSSGSLGEAIVMKLAGAGCNCVCHYNQNREKAQKLVEKISCLPVKALSVRADLTDAAQIEALFEQAMQLGTPQVLINSAGVFSRQGLAEVSQEEALRVLNMNLVSAILTSRSFAKGIKEKFGSPELPVGKIVNISGVAGIRPWAKYVVYCSSKAALIGATKALAKELAPAICVNSIAPGLVTWPADFTDEQKARQLKLVPLGRKAEPEEIAAAIVFLLENDYITGQVLNVDGGRCI